MTIERMATTKATIWAPGKRIRSKGDLYIVTEISGVKWVTDGLSYGLPLNDGWLYTATCRAATAAEDAESRRITRIAQLQKELDGITGPADDARDDDRRRTERQAIMDEITSLEAVS